MGHPDYTYEECPISWVAHRGCNKETRELSDKEAIHGLKLLYKETKDSGLLLRIKDIEAKKKQREELWTSG